MRAACVVLLGCGDVHHDADPDAAAPAIDAAANPCAPRTCVLIDEFDGAALDGRVWSVATGGGATVLQHDGMLTLHLPAAADAYADVSSLIGFPASAALEAKVTVTGGQFFDHKGIGFASAMVSSGCDAGEAEAAMFRGQDGDGYLETKAGNTATCTRQLVNYPPGDRTLQITRSGGQVVFRDSGTTYDPIKTTVPAGLLPVRFSAYTFTQAPMQPVQIDVAYVRVSKP
jgi:hypothetical protein